VLRNPRSGLAIPFAIRIAVWDRLSIRRDHDNRGIRWLPLDSAVFVA